MTTLDVSSSRTLFNQLNKYYDFKDDQEPRERIRP